MTLDIKKLSGTEIEISGELESSVFNNFWADAVEKISARTKLDGFRQGKIPENILVEKVGEGEILEEAAQLALEETWPKIILEQKIEAIGKPEIIITKLARGNPLGFKIKTTVLPEIELPNYRDIAKKIFERTDPEIIVEDKELDGALEYLQKARTKDNPTAGEATEINDEFAKGLGNFNDLNALKQNLRENIKIEKTIKQGEKKRMEVLDSIAKGAKIDIPGVLIEYEKQKMLGELKENLAGIGLQWEHYLDHIKKTENDLQNEWGPEAEKRVRFGLSLREIAKKENIEIKKEELESQVTKLLANVPVEEANSLDPEKLRDYAYGIIRNDKVFKLLENKEPAS